MPRFARPRVSAQAAPSLPSLPQLLPRKRAAIDRGIIAVTAAFSIWVLAARLSGTLKFQQQPPKCQPALPSWPAGIPHHEDKVFSQNGEDGIIAYIFANIGTRNRYYVEFGTENGSECNTRLLREQKGWSGLLMDGGHENRTMGLHREFITPENINSLFAKYEVPEEFDLLSIDVNYDDWFVWRSIGAKYRPRVVIIEYNSALAPDVRWVVDPQDGQRWPSAAGATNYFGASLKAYRDLGRSLGYTLVGCDSDGVNAFFVRTEILECQGARVPPYAQLYVHAAYHRAETNASRQWIVLDERLEETGRVAAVNVPHHIE